MEYSSITELEYDLAPHSVMLGTLYKSIQDKVVLFKCLMTPVCLAIKAPNYLYITYIIV